MIFNIALTLGLFGIVEIAFWDASMRIVPSQMARVAIIVFGAYAIQGTLAWVLAVLGLPTDAVRFSTTLKMDWQSPRNLKIHRQLLPDLAQLLHIFPMVLVATLMWLLDGSVNRDGGFLLLVLFGAAAVWASLHMELWK
ncbi:hypothetical protein HY414_01120 [Candidatus Kaiserbacteria bacterium]|nr:hypothetical protein [Candidatus Kaiserbacteria bacterium]